MSPVYIAVGQDYTPNKLTVDIFFDGSVNIDYSIEPDPMLPRINVTLPRNYYTELLAVDEDGIIMDWEQNTDGIEVDSIGAEELTISYSSSFLTNKTGSMWTVSIESPVSTLFILPLDAILVRLSSTPSAISITDNRAAIKMPQGLNSISYMLETGGTKEHSVVLLSQASIKISQATHKGIIVNHTETMLIQATQAHEAGSYVLSEQLSKQIILETGNIVELASQAKDQITIAEDLLDARTGSINQETIDSVNILLADAKLNYDEGKYISSNAKAFGAYSLIQDAIGIFYMKKMGKTSIEPLDFDENLVEVNLDQILRDKKYLRMRSLGCKLEPWFHLVPPRSSYIPYGMLGRTKMNKKMITLTTLLTTLLATSFMGGAYLVNAQEVDENQVTAENLLSQLNELENEVTSLFETITGDGAEVSEDAAESLLEAQELHTEAQGLYDEGNYEESVEKATDALNKYGIAITKATPEEPEDPEDPEEPETMTTAEQEEEETEKMIGITTAIEKAEKRIAKLIEIADELDTLEIDTREARDILAAASEKLGSISLENPEEAETLLSEAKSLIGDATGMLKSKGEPIKEEKIEHFTQQAIHHVNQLNTKMNRFLEKFGSTEETSLLMQAQYSDIMAGLEGIDTKDGLKAAVTQLKLLEKETRNVGKGTEVEELIGEETFESLKGQMKLESKLEHYWEIVNEMDDEDPVKAEAGELLAQAEDLLRGAETALVEGEEEHSDEMVEEAEEIIDNIEDLLGDYLKGNGKGVKPDKAINEAKSNGKSPNKDDDSTEETTENPDPEDPDDPEEPDDPETITT
jgi:tetratricopeptide (TPR) repeat protein